MAVSVTPSPQFRYLEPYKNRVFQYDTPNSNLFLSQYANNLLRVVGNDCVVRGLNVTATPHANEQDLIISITAGSLIHDLTYIEINSATELVLENVANYTSTMKVLVYTNFKYVNSIYENNLSIAATLYNPITQKTVTPWDSNRYRVVLAIFDLTIVDGKLENVAINTDMDFLEIDDMNEIQNGSFTSLTTEFWSPIDATFSVSETGGVEDSPYVIVNRTTGSEQGLYQVISTNIGTTYKFNFWVKTGSAGDGDFSAKAMNGDYNIDPLGSVLTTVSGTSTSTWTKYTGKFIATSTKTTLIILKSNNTSGTMLFDEISCFAVTTNRKQTDTGLINIVDGGIL